MQKLIQELEEERYRTKVGLTDRIIKALKAGEKLREDVEKVAKRNVDIGTIDLLDQAIKTYDESL